MKLIDAYVSEVGRHLHGKNRADLQQEIRSLIEDAMEDAALSQGRAPDEEMVVGVLKQFGAPQKVALSYGSSQYLIGPRLYPTFWMVLRIVLAVMLVISSVAIGLDIARMEPGQSVFELIAEVFASVLGSLIAAFGNVVLVFAILERLLPEETWQEKEWDPRKLQAEPDPEEVKMIDPVLGTIFTLVFLLILNLYPHWLGISSIVDGNWVHVPVLSEAFFRYLPFINILLALDIVRNALLLQQGRWTGALRWFAVFTSLAGVLLTVWMLAGPAIIDFNPADLARLGWDVTSIEAAGSLPSLHTIARIVLGIALAGNLWDLLTKLYRLVTRRSQLIISA